MIIMPVEDTSDIPDVICVGFHNAEGHVKSLCKSHQVREDLICSYTSFYLERFCRPYVYVKHEREVRTKCKSFPYERFD